MKIEISRDSYQPEKRYSGVYQQQGRMLTDADWNELVEILKQRLNEALKDVVGSKEGSIGGTPRHRALRLTKDGDDINIHPGLVYVNGISAQVTGDGIIAYENQDDFPSAPEPAGNYILYADVWERTVTQLMDDRLRDKGLHGADTCSRKQTMAQVKWCPDSINPEQSAANPSKGNAELSITLLQKTTESDPCDPCADQLDVDSNVGNYLFRVEVHDVQGDASNPDEITLKWSSENGAEQFEVMPTKEEMPAGFVDNKFVYEFFNETSEKHLGVHLDGGASVPVREALFGVYPASLPVGFNLVRRWDGYCRLTLSTSTLEEGMDKGITLSTSKAPEALGYVHLDSSSLQTILTSIKLDMALTDKSFVAGDFWLADVREVENDPLDPVKSKLLETETPQGIEHHYLTLATVESGVLIDNPEAGRKYAFPALTEMTRMFIAGGDGQEVIPGEPLPQPLRVSVGNGEWPVEGVSVRFQVESGAGTLNPLAGIIKTSANGVAECEWIPDSSIGAENRVKVTLVDPHDTTQDLEHPPVYFYTNLITADQVAYEAGCPVSGENAVHSLLVDDGDVGLVLGSDNYYTVKEVLDALLCKLRAKHIPYDPTNISRWNDINEEEDPGVDPPDTVQKAIDDLLENLHSEDIKYPLPTCTDTNTLKSYITADIANIVNEDGKDYARIKDLWDALLCHLDASKLPYNSAIKGDRWEDINEELGGSPAKPDTVQDAIDNIVDNLESSDIKYTFPDCEELGGVPSFKSLIYGNVQNKFVEDGKSKSKIEDLWDALLCHLNAAKVPLDKTDEDLCDSFMDAETVQDALKVLCDRSANGGGCSVTVGLDGEYRTIQEAFEKIEDLDIVICLLSGGNKHHIISGDLVSTKRRSIKITGAGAYASVIQLQGNILFDASQIILQDIGFKVVDDPGKSNIGHGQIVLGEEICDRVDVQRCRFVRTSQNKEGVTKPLVEIYARHIRWQKNDSEARRYIPGFREVVIPGGIRANPAVADAVKDIDEIWHKGPVDPGVKNDAFEAVLESAAASIKGLPANEIDSWVNSKPAEIIDLPVEFRPRVRSSGGLSVIDAVSGTGAIAERSLLASYTRKASVSPRGTVESIYEMLPEAGSMSIESIKDILRDMVAATYEDDVALAPGAEPDYLEIAYSTISGILCLQSDYDDEFPVSRSGLSLTINSPEYVISKSGVALLHANTISRIITKIPKGIFEDGLIKNPLPGFDQLSLTKNIIGGLENSLISTSLTLEGNHFEWSTPKDVVALVIARSGIFTANQGGYSEGKQSSKSSSGIAIQRLLEEKRQSANKLLFLDIREPGKPHLEWNNGQEIAAGTVMAFASAKPPEGWLECNAAQLTSDIYPALFSAIEVNYGSGNGAPGRFNLPDLRGEFIRGWDHGRGADPGRNFATKQTDQYQGHSFRDAGHAHAVQLGNNTRHGPDIWVQHADTRGGNWGHSGTTANVANIVGPINVGYGTPRFGTETRPKNVAMMYCIKY